MQNNGNASHPFMITLQNLMYFRRLHITKVVNDVCQNKITLFTSNHLLQFNCDLVWQHPSNLIIQMSPMQIMGKIKPSASICFFSFGPMMTPIHSLNNEWFLTRQNGIPLLIIVTASSSIFISYFTRTLQTAEGGITYFLITT